MKYRLFIKMKQLIGFLAIGAVSALILYVLLYGGEESALIVLTDHNKPTVEETLPHNSIFLDKDKFSDLSEEDVLAILNSKAQSTVVNVSDAEKISSEFVSLPGAGRLAAAGYKTTNLTYDGQSFVIAKMTPEFTVPTAFSLRNKIDYDLKYVQLSDYAQFTPEYTEVEVSRPAIDMYMGYIIVDNGTSLSIYSNTGKYITSFDDRNYIPAYTRDSSGNPLFYKTTEIESGQYSGEIVVEDTSGNVYFDRDPHKKEETIFIHGQLENKGEGEALKEEVKVYYSLSNAGYFAASSYNDALENRGLYFDYPTYYGVPDSNIDLYAEVYNRYLTDIDGYVSMTHKIDWSFRKWDAPINEEKYQRAYNFKNGLACVVTEGYYKDGGLFFINGNGTRAFNTFKTYNNENSARYIIENYMPPITYGPESIGYFYFDQGYVRARFETIDYWNYDSNNVIQVYSSEEVLLNSRGEQFPIPEGYELKAYSNGMLLLEKEGLYGFMDNSGKWIAEPIYTDAEAFYEGLAILKTSDGRYGMIDTKGKIVLPFAYSHLSSCSDGVIVAYSETNGWEIFRKMTV